MNKIILAGRMTRDPELKTTNTGTEVCNFSVAVDRRFAPKGEEKQADFINCTAWQKTAAFVDKYFKKGDGITIEGRLESRKYVDKDGNNRVAWDVICDNVEFPLGKSGGNSSNTYEASGSFATADVSAINVEDSDLPF